MEYGAEKDEKLWHKFAACNDQQALLSCLPGKGVGGGGAAHSAKNTTDAAPCVVCASCEVCASREVNCIWGPLSLSGASTPE